MREYLGNFLLTLSEKVLGRKACRIYNRVGYSTYRSDGHKGHSPFLKEQAIKEFLYHRLLENIHPYKGFEEHYLLVPKREVETLLDLTETEKLELVDLIGTYEAQGYNTVSHQFGTSSYTSVSHKHVHLLK